jgi:hypothetical protein
MLWDWLLMLMLQWRACPAIPLMTMQAVIFSEPANRCRIPLVRTRLAPYSSFTPLQIHAAIEFNANEGHLYSTMDDCFKCADM